MNFFAKSPYANPTGISLFLHGVLLGIFLVAGVFSPSVAQPPEIVAVEVEIVPAVVADVRDIPPAPPGAPPPAGPGEKPVPKAAQAPNPVRFEALPPALPGESSENSVAITLPAGSGTVATAVVGGGKGGETNDGGGEQTAASRLYGPKPGYPQSARKAGWEGAVVLGIRINTDGSVTVLSVREAGRADAGAAAAQAVATWRYSAARDANGVPVVSYRDIRVRFRLADEE